MLAGSCIQPGQQRHNIPPWIWEPHRGIQQIPQALLWWYVGSLHFIVWRMVCNARVEGWACSQLSLACPRLRGCVPFKLAHSQSCPPPCASSVVLNMLCTHAHTGHENVSIYEERGIYKNFSTPVKDLTVNKFCTNCACFSLGPTPCDFLLYFCARTFI